MNSIYFELVGDVSVGITITELADGSLGFDLEVLTETGVIGDLNALYLDILDESLISGLSVSSGTDVTGEKYKEDGVTKIDNFTNVNGEVVNELGKFDLGIQFGTSGMATDDIQTTSFVLSHDSQSLSLSDFVDQDAAVRLTSVGEIDGAREGSSKIGGVVDPVDGGPGNEEPPVSTANNDTMTVSSSETFNSGSTDELDTGGQSGLLSLLENDTTEGAAYGGTVETVNGAARSDGTIYSGSNGGLLIVNADGTVDFSANDEFYYLPPGRSTTTDFEYGIEGGSTATLTVTVIKESDDDIGLYTYSEPEPEIITTDDALVF